MVLLGEEAQVEAWFGQFGDSANPYQGRCMVCMEHWKSIWMHPMELLDDVCHMDLTLVCLETVLVSVQDMCMVCT